MKKQLLVFIPLLLVFANPAFSQMRSGEQMKNYEEVFGVKINQRSFPYDVTLIESKPAGNVLAPGEQPEFTFLLKNNLGQPLQTSGHVDVLSYGTRGIPGDIWMPELFKISELPQIPIHVHVAAGGSQVIKVRANLPATFGAYALVMDLGETGRRFATSCVRTFAVAPQKIEYAKMSLDDSVGPDVLKALGVQSIRMSYGYVPTTDPSYAAEMEALDKKLQEFSSRNITVMIMFMAGPHSPEPFGRGRPHLNADGVMLNTKQDLAWAPQNDPDFQKFVAAICKKHGWPAGPVTAVELWNEPWDGISISGWGADLLRFREIYTAMAQGVEEARQTGSQVLLAGCDSSTNTFDKLFPDGKDTFLKWFDVCTIHYQGLTAPVLFRAWLNRESPLGRIRVWDTESWVANTDDRVATVVAADRAAGYDRAMGVYAGNISAENKKSIVMPDGTQKDVDTFHAWSTAAAVGAAQHFIGERNFHELVFKNGLPWVMSFDGLKNNQDDGTVVIAGDLTEEFGEYLPYQGVRGMAELKAKEALRKQLDALPADSTERASLQTQLAAKSILSGASLTLKDPANEFVLYDFYGNPVAADKGTIQVPLDGRGFFLRTNGVSGSFARLIRAIVDSRIEGYEPLNVIAHDMLAPVDQKSHLHLSLTNILNRPIHGTLQVSLGALTLDIPASLDFQANETKEVSIPITGGVPTSDNTYPLSFRFDAGTDGYSTHQENLHVNVIAKRTINIDGNLDDWKGVLPQPVYASGNQGPGLMESAWLPFAKFSNTQKPGFATDPSYAAEMEALDKKLQEFSSRNITVMIMFMAGPHSPEPFGRGRPHLNADGVMLNTKQDLAWAPQNDPDFQKFVAAICKKHGWPAGPVTAVELWNEPWDGISISGWGADLLRFREIYTAMAQGVEEARQTGSQVLLAGCDSSTNTFDKLFPDGKDTFLKWFDVCTIHYQGLTAPVLFRAWLNRESPLGRIRVWDTESWVANTDDRVATVVAADRAAGYDRAMGVYAGNISAENKKSIVMPDGTQKDVDTFHAWSTAAAVGAAQHFIGERNFHELVFKNGLPWVMSFDGLKNNQDDGTVVIAGDLTEEFGEYLPYQGVRGMAELKAKEALRKQLDALPADSTERASLQTQLAAKSILSGASLTLKDPANEFVLYDFYGNPVAADKGTIQVPLDGRGFFLRTNGVSGSFARLIRAIVDSRIEGYEPLNVIAHDMLAPVDQKSHLHLSLTNILNRPIHGTLQVSLGALTLDIPASLDFQANETKEVSIPITGGVPTSDNTYPLSFRFDAGTDGYSTHQENLHVNVIAKRTINIDGNLDDWKGVLPQPVYASGNQGPGLMESAWLPFAKFSNTQKPGFATGYLAYDDKNLYFAAKIADNTVDPGTLRYENRNDDDYFYPETSYEYNPDKTLLKSEDEWKESLREQGALFVPGSTTQRSFKAWNSVSSAFAIDMDLPKDSCKRVSFYFVDSDDYKNGRRVVFVEVHDAVSGKTLANTHVSEYGHGCYANFLVSGKVRFIFRSQSWLNASLSGVFFDAADGSKRPAGAASAVFEGLDNHTGANWQAKYGHDGYNVIGSEPKYPAYAKVIAPDVVEKIEHHWPDGVRRYSYRRRPELPFGSSPNKFDNVQLAFNVIPMHQKADMIPFPPGTMPGFVPHSDTDYEYALNKVSDSHGGGTEIWRSLVPGMPRKSFFPRQPASPFDGPVKDGKLVVKYDGNTRIVEAALPWTEIPLVKQAMEAGNRVKFSFRVNDNDGPSMELAEGRSVSKKNSYTFHPDWTEHWANEIEFAFEK